MNAIQWMCFAVTLILPALCWWWVVRVAVTGNSASVPASYWLGFLLLVAQPAAAIVWAVAA